MTDTRTGTRNLILTPEEIRWLAQWASHEWLMLEAERMKTPWESPQERAILADQLTIESIQQKLRG